MTDSAIVRHDDGSYTVPENYRGALPPIPESDYPPDATPLEPLEPYPDDPDEDETETEKEPD